jgi:acyl-CoA reductase-like NAD-dependent aldehyde dehydrogenase
MSTTTESRSAAPPQPWQPPRPQPRVPQGQIYVDGQWVAGFGDPRDVVDPATGSVIHRVPESTAEDINRAVTAARRAFDDGPWRAMTPRERGRVLLAAAELMRAHHEELAQLESLDTGKPLMFSRMVDVNNALDQFDYYGTLATGIEGAARTTSVPSLSYTRREPLGVVAAITPFNFPMVLSLTKIAPALVAGNTVVHKPAEETPLTALRIAGLLTEAGLPDGVLNVVTGDAQVGAALIAEPRIDKIAFTGSTAAGRRVAAAAGATLKPVTVELGGKSANIIFADADPDAAIRTAVNAFVFNTGQFCMAGSRVLVERPVYEAVVGALGAASDAVPVGDPFAEGTVVGPMAGPRHLEKVRWYLDHARDGAARVLGGSNAPTGSAGFWAAPTVLADVAQDSRLVQEEIFGPVVTVQPFDTEEQAIEMANGVGYGLSAGLQTRDVSRAHRVAARLEAGMVWVNTWALLDSGMPFGGYKSSGYGREGGPDGLDEYLRTKSVVVALG